MKRIAILLALMLALAVGCAAAAGTIANVKISAEGILTWSAYPGGTGDYFLYVDGQGAGACAPDSPTPVSLNSIIEELLAQGLLHNTPKHDIELETYDEGGSLLAAWQGTYNYLSPSYPEYSVPTVKLNPTVSAGGIMSWEAHSTDTVSYAYGVEGFTNLTTELSVDIWGYIDSLVTNWTIPWATSFKVELLALNAKGETLDSWTGTVKHTPVIELIDIGNTMCTGIQEAGYRYTGKPIEPVIELMFGDHVLEKDKDYTVSYHDNVKPGLAWMNVAGKGQFCGSFTQHFSIIGTTATEGGLKYKISGSTATVTGPKSKKATRLVIPDNLEIWGQSYRVVAIKASAFKGMKKLKTVEIGANVKTIGRNAFYKCAKLKTIIIRTAKLTSKTVGANAFKGVYKKAIVKVPAQKLKAYKTLLKKKGLPKTAKLQKQ